MALALFALASAHSHAWAGPTEDAAAAVERAREARSLAAGGKLAQAFEEASTALAMAERAGTEKSLVGIIESDIGDYLRRLGRLAEAERHGRRAVEILRSSAPQSAELAVAANNYGGTLSDLGRHREAEAQYKSALDIFRGGNRELRAPPAIQVARNLGMLYVELARNGDADALLDDAVRGAASLWSEKDPRTIALRLDLAKARLARGDPRSAEEFVRQAITSLDKGGRTAESVLVTARGTLGDILMARGDVRGAQAELEAAAKMASVLADGELQRANILSTLGSLHVIRGDYVQAEQNFRRAHDLYRRRLGEGHPGVARALFGIAVANQMLGRFDEAKEFYDRVLSLLSRALGPTHPQIASVQSERARLSLEMGEPAGAARDARAALKILDDWPRGRENVLHQRGLALSALGFALSAQRPDDDEAIRVFEASTDAIAEARGGDSPDLPPGLTRLGKLYLAKGRIADAERVLERALAIRIKDAAREPRTLAETLAVLAEAREKAGRADEALETIRRATAILEARFGASERTLARWSTSNQEAVRWIIDRHVWIADEHLGESATAETFRVGQLSRLTAADTAMSRMAARFATTSGRLAEQVRAQQDALDRWSAADQAATQLLARPAEGRSNEALERLRQEAASADRTARDLGEKLDREFPDYAELTRPSPADLSAVQLVLRQREALLLQVTGESATYLWLIRADGAWQRRTNLSRKALARDAARVRRSVDLSDASGKAPEFAFEAAYRLYEGLMQPLEEQLRGVEHLIVVADGEMLGLPPALLLTEPPADDVDPRGKPWLIRRHAISVLPSVGSLLALRKVAHQSRADLPFLGVGDPVLLGGTGGGQRRATLPLTRGAAAIDPELIRSAMAPLPETRDELERIAGTLGADRTSLLLGSQATETQVKRTTLSRYKVIAFATHGLVAGELSGAREPSLVLTPPKKASAGDDGLLTMSEIAQLKLDADWIILSACNTASSDGTPGGEGLSGLAKAFFFAGARTLLVSHWAIASDAAALLTTGIFEEIAQTPGTGRAEALRRSMLRLIDRPARPVLAHPAFWSPFVIVGEGA